MHRFPISDSKSQSSRLFFALLLLLLTAGTVPKSLTATPQTARQLPQQEQASSDPKSDTDQQDSAKNTKGQREQPQENTLGLQTIKNIVRDQGQIWTSPSHFRFGPAAWLDPNHW